MINNLYKQSITSKIILFIFYLFIILIYSFDVRSFLGSVIPISLITSVVFLIIIFCLFFLVVCRNNYNSGLLKLGIVDYLATIIFILYGLRLFYNIYVEEIYQTTFVNRTTYIIYYIFLTILPYIICRRIPWKKIRMKKIILILFFIYLIGLLLSFRNILSESFSSDGRYGANELLDTIGYGHISLTFIIISIYLFSFYNKYRIKYIFIMAMLFGLLSMAIANSRSPFVALILLIIIINLSKIKAHVLLLSLLLCSIFIFNINEIDIFLQENFNSSFIQRFLTIFEFSMNNSSDRGYFFSEGLNLFYDNPIFGRSILLIDDLKGGYPHNMFIEILMSVGVFAGCIFISMNIIILYYSYILIKNRNSYYIFGLIFIQYFVLLQFSRTIVVVPMYWASMATVYSVYKLKIKNNE